MQNKPPNIDQKGEFAELLIYSGRLPNRLQRVMTQFPSFTILNAISSTSPHLSNVFSSPIVHLFCRNIRLANAAMRVDDVVVSVDAAEDGISLPLNIPRFAWITSS